MASSAESSAEDGKTSEDGREIARYEKCVQEMARQASREEAGGEG